MNIGATLNLQFKTFTRYSIKEGAGPAIKCGYLAWSLRNTVIVAATSKLCKKETTDNCSAKGPPAWVRSTHRRLGCLQKPSSVRAKRNHAQRRHHRIRWSPFADIFTPFTTQLCCIFSKSLAKWHAASPMASWHGNPSPSDPMESVYPHFPLPPLLYFAVHFLILSRTDTRRVR